MRRSWWHDIVIIGSLILIAGVGVAAIWGPSIERALWPSQRAQPQPPGPGPGPTSTTVL